MIKERIKEVKKLINDYFTREYDETLDNQTLYDNLEDFGLAYTTTDDWEEFSEDEIHEVQVSTNIKEMTLQTYLDDTLLENYKFDSWEEYKMFLQCLDFDEMIADAHDVYRSWKRVMKLNKVVA